MKTGVETRATALAEEFKALDHQLSPQSVERFQRNDRVWPVELWMKVRDEKGNHRLEMIQLYADPCDPGPGSGPLEREWRERDGGIRHGYIRTVKECPERIIAGCLMTTEIERSIAAWWEMDNGAERGYLERGYLERGCPERGCPERECPERG